MALMNDPLVANGTDLHHLQTRQPGTPAVKIQYPALTSTYRSDLPMTQFSATIEKIPHLKNTLFYS